MFSDVAMLDRGHDMTTRAECVAQNEIPIPTQEQKFNLISCRVTWVYCEVPQVKAGQFFLFVGQSLQK